MDYIALDVETANRHRWSICQIGLVIVKNNKIVDKQSFLIDPQCSFARVNTSVHGITRKKVVGEPLFPEVFEKIRPALESHVVVHHSPFDRVAIKHANTKYNIVSSDIIFLDSAEIASFHWPNIEGGYGLKNLADKINFDFAHHDALQDALAAHAIFSTILAESGHPLDWFVERAGVSLSSIPEPKIIETNQSSNTRKDSAGDGNPDGEHFGKTIVFTGDLTMPRSAAAEWAKLAGLSVRNSVSSKTNILCVGVPNLESFAVGHDKSSKQRRAEELIAQGHPIKIITEDDFLKMCLTDKEPHKNSEIIKQRQADYKKTKAVIEKGQNKTPQQQAAHREDKEKSQAAHKPLLSPPKKREEGTNNGLIWVLIIIISILMIFGIKSYLGH